MATIADVMQSVVLTANQNFTTTAYVDVTNLAFTIGANQSAIFWMDVPILRSIGGVDLVLGCTTPAGMVHRLWTFHGPANTSVLAVRAPADGEGDFVVPSTGGNYCHRFFGSFKNGANAGTVQFKGKQNGAGHANPNGVLAGTSLTAIVFDGDSVTTDNLDLIAVRKSLDEAISSDITYGPVTDMTFPIGANEEWVSMWVIYSKSTGGGTDFRWAWYGPSGISSQYGGEGPANTGPWTGIDTITDTNPAALDNGTDQLYFLTGSCKNGATPGNEYVQWRQTSSSGTPSNIGAGTAFVAFKVV